MRINETDTIADFNKYRDAAHRSTADTTRCVIMKGAAQIERGRTS